MAPNDTTTGSGSKPSLTLEQKLEALARVVSTLTPLAGIVVSTGSFLVELARHTKMDAAQVQAYAAALATYQAARADLGAALDEFHTLFPAETPTKTTSTAPRNMDQPF